MKPPRSSKNDVFLRYKLWLSAVSGEGIIGEGQYQLLREIEKKGSLKAAAECLGTSYRKAWGDIKNAEELLGYDLTEKVRGGIDAAIYRARHEWGYEFATRTIKNDETGRSMRVWRTK